VEQPDGGTRFTMLASIREFAREQLAATDDAIVLAERHAAYYCQLVEHAAAGLRTRAHEPSIDRLEQELDNVRAGWTWVEQHAAVDLGARLLRAQRMMWLFWREQGRIREGQQRIETLLTAIPAPPLAQASALNALGALATERNDAVLAQSLHQDALVLARSHADQVEEIASLLGLGRAVSWLGSSSTLSVPFFDEALAIARAIDDHRFLIGILHDLGDAWFELGDHERGTALVVEALELARADGDDHGIAAALMNLAFNTQLGVGDPAGERFRESLVLLQGRRGGQRSRPIANVIHGLATVALTQGAPTRAVRLYGAAATMREALAVPLPAFYQPVYEQQLADTRRLLDDLAWEQAWSEGRAMALDQVIAYALEPTRTAADPPVGATTAGVAMLSRREREVVALLVEGKSNQEIADVLFISSHTVASHVANVMNKLGLDSRTAVATWAMRHGLG
jgi:non-specific serine/threonine protein kinase